MTKNLLMLTIWVLLVSCSEPKYVLQPKVVNLSDTMNILPLGDSTAMAVHYQKIPSLDHLPVDSSKEAFIAIVLPAILIARHEIAVNRERIAQLQEQDQWTAADSAFHQEMMTRYQAKNAPQLLKRMQTHPNSIVLAQAAVESGWGSSRFFRKGNNLFGIWSYKASEPRIPAAFGDMYLRKYDDISTSIRDYFETIGRTRAYRKFREVRAKTDQIDQLLPHLKSYSERGGAYIDQLRTIIRQNDLTRYDSFTLHPDSFVPKDSSS